MPFITEPRSAATYTAIALALLAGIALGDVLFPFLAGIERRKSSAEPVNPLSAWSVRVSLLFTALYLLGTLSLYGSQVAGARLPAGDQAAFEWIKANTPQGSTFLLLTGNSDVQLFCDPSLEWFPAVTGRISITTIQGREWQNGAEFGSISAATQSAAACLSAESPLDCLSGIRSASNTPLAFDYLYVARTTRVLAGCRLTGTSMRGENLIDQLKASSGYTPVYESDNVAVFQKH